MVKSLVAAVIAAVMTVPAGSVLAADPIWVLVGGPREWRPNPGYRLEIGGTAWSINSNNGGGVTTVAAIEPLLVRLVNLEGCVEVTRFSAPPETSWVIEVHADGSVDVEDVTGRGLDAGPALDPVDAGGLCAPDTSVDSASTDGATSSAKAKDPVRSMAPLAAGALAILCWIVRPHRRRLDRPSETPGGGARCWPRSA